jgi:hypothetical protein
VTAIVWKTSRCALPAKRLTSLVAELAQGQAPMPLWLGCQGGTEGARGATTCGLYPLLGAEIEVVSPNLTAETAVTVALDLATEILRAGEPPAHGASRGAGSVPAVVLTHVKHLAEPKAAAGAA